MQFHFGDLVTAANLFVLLGIYRKMSIIVYQHKLMWTDFAQRKGISPNGKGSRRKPMNIGLASRESE